eukprot:gene2814-3069_t
MNANSAIISQVEIWQAQTYWPIKGWAAPLSGTPHYTCVLLSSGVTDTFPNDLLPPVGWKWVEDWSIDSSSQYGNPDGEGWLYAATFDRLHEQMRNAAATGLAAATCMVRKRRWIRTITCISTDLAIKIRDRAERVVQIRVNIEASLKNKEASLKEINVYETQRAAVFAQSLQVATQATLTSLGMLKDISNKLRVVKQYLSDRALMEREHSIRLEKLAQKYLPLPYSSIGGDGSITPITSDSRSSPRPEDVSESLAEELTRKTSLTPAALSQLDQQQSTTAAADLFFNKIVAATKAQAQTLEDYSKTLLPLLSELDSLQEEIQEILRDARSRFRKNSDICRLSEAAIINFQNSAHVAYKNVSLAALQEVELLTEELTCLRGGLPFHPVFYERVQSGNHSTLQNPPISWKVSFLQSANQSSGQGGNGQAKRPSAQSVVTKKLSKELLTSSNSEVNSTGMMNREDFWLSVQRYKVAVRDAQEALSVLISEYMDLDLQQQIITNRSYHLLNRLSKQYVEEEVSLYDSLTQLYTSAMKDLLSNLKLLEIRRILSASSTAGSGSGSGSRDSDIVLSSQTVPQPPNLNPTTQLTATSNYDYIISMGLNNVVLANNTQNKESQSFSQSLNWRTVWVVATSDGFLHILFDHLCNIPDRSFCLRNCLLREIKAQSPPLFHAAFEIAPSRNSTGWTNAEARPLGSPAKRRASKANLSQGFVFCQLDGSSLSEWLADLNELSYSTVTSYNEVESSHQEALLQSLPILKGETAQIDLEMHQYAEVEGSETSSDYGSQKDITEGGEDEDGSSSCKDVVGLVAHTGKFSDDETDYPASAATSPFKSPYPSKLVMIDSPQTDYGASATAAATTATTFATTTSDSLDEVQREQLRQQERMEEHELLQLEEDRKQRSEEIHQEGVEIHQEEDDDDEAEGEEERLEEDREEADGVEETVIMEGSDLVLNNNSNNNNSSGNPNKLQTNAQHNRQQSSEKTTPPPIRSIRRYAGHVSTSKYERKDSSWIKHEANGEHGARTRSQIVGMVPVASEIKPVQLIPNVDKDMPLFKRHSQMIAQYEQGLQQEKKRISMKVQETKGERLKDLVVDNRPPRAFVPISDGGQEAALTPTPQTQSPATTTTAAAASPAEVETGIAKARTLGVKKLSKVFDMKSMVGSEGQQHVEESAPSLSDSANTIS